jgi:hypothetical protein
VNNPTPLSDPIGTLSLRERVGVRVAPKTRRNIYMGQEYLDMEAIVVQERKRTGKDLSVADLIRKACRDYVDGYWKAEANRRPG